MIPLQPPLAGKLTLSSVWQVLGPFQIGTREASWGADPLEYYGGFRSLEFDQDAVFKSSLIPNANVTWSSLRASSVSAAQSGANVSLTLSFPDVDWQFLRSVQGWSALQYQAWARGEITVTADEPQTAVLYTDHILEFWVDDKHYFGGDFYAYRKAPPVLRLEPGSHRLDLRLVRDVRAMGGFGEPMIDVDIAVRLCATQEPLELADESILIPDIVDQKLAGLYGSFAIRNTGTEVVHILGVSPENHGEWVGRMGNTETDGSLKILPGQTRPIAFEIHLETPDVSQLRMKMVYTYHSLKAPHTWITTSQKVTRKSIYEPHKMTFKHPGGIISYAILRPPSKNATCEGFHSAPILLQLHGAGREAEEDIVSHALDPLPDLCAWVVFPSGVTSWSGDDWHSWGFADVEAAISSINDWISTTGWQGVAVDSDRWLVSGHSNGGQGTWYTMTHRPDKIIAAAPVSGYLSIERYVPYDFWYPMDPRRQSILYASLNSYRHELLAENCQGIPILQQHGSDDDNVPAYHSRLMNQLLMQAGAGSNYFELPGKGHWYDGVMTTEHLSEFYRKYIPTGNTTSARLRQFTLVVANPSNMGSKGGITVTQLETPGQYGRMDVSIDPLDEETCLYSIQTSNILSFKLRPHTCSTVQAIVDKKEIASFTKGGLDYAEEGDITISRSRSGWEMSFIESTRSALTHRRGWQLGAMDAILHTNGIFTVFSYGKGTGDIALQISRNLHQYFLADAVIADAHEYDEPRGGNTITIAVGHNIPMGVFHEFPIRMMESLELIIRDAGGNVREYDVEDGLSAIFLRPGLQESLELVVWGSDIEDVTIAARLVPLLTGVGQPDFIVLRKSSKWKGVEGVVAMGFFDQEWNVTRTSFFA